MKRASPVNHPPATWIHVALLVCLTCLAHADPLPMEEMFAGGRIMPAEQVPVDMASETLNVTLTRIPSERPDSPFEQMRGLCIADVSAEYALQADEDMTVPVLFPVVGAAAEMAFSVNGKPVEPRIVRDADIFAAYSPAWRRTIDGFIAGDKRLSEIVSDAQPAIEKARKLREEDHRRSSSGLYSRLSGQFGRRLRQLGLPEDLNWELARYVQDDWDKYLEDGPGPGGTPYAAARIRMWSERELALAIDPESPDPLALWMPPPTSMFTPLVFAMAELPLEAGNNSLEVSYRQPVSFRNREPANPPKRDFVKSHGQVSQFDFILQTARFWRSFGDLQCTIDLPGDTVQAECNLSGAEVDLSGDPRVRLITSGLPDENLRVDFAVFEWKEAEGEPEAPEDVPEIALDVAWEDVVETDGERRAFGRMSPLIAGDRLFAGYAEHVIVYDLESGEREAEFGIGGEPSEVVLEGERLLIAYEARIGRRGVDHALGLAMADLASKSLQWALHDTSECNGAPGGVLIADETAVGWGVRGPVLAADLDSGEKLWEMEFAARGAVTDGERVYVCGSADTSSGDHADAKRSSVIALDARSGERLWETPVGYWALEVALDGSRLLAISTKTRASDTQMVALRADDGDVLWRHALSRSVSSNGVHQIIPFGDGVTVIDDQGISHWTLGPPPREAWRLQSKYQMLESPRVQNGHACMLMEAGLARVDLASGAIEWTAPQFEHRGPFFAGVGERVAKVERMNGAVVCFEAATDGAEEPREVPLAGAVPEDVRETLSSAPAAGWPEPLMMSVYQDQFKPSGGLAPDDPEYTVNAGYVDLSAEPVSPPEPERAAQHTGAPANRGAWRSLAGTVIALVALVLIVGAVIWRRNGS